jgi:hypothetical protein
MKTETARIRAIAAVAKEYGFERYVGQAEDFARKIIAAEDALVQHAA